MTTSGSRGPFPCVLQLSGHPDSLIGRDDEAHHTTPQITQYTLRHYFISKAVMAGVDLFTISKWAGHGSTQMIENVYGHLSSEHKKTQMAKIRVGGKDAKEGLGA